MIAGYIILGVILFAIGLAATKSLPSFARHMRISLRLAAGFDSERSRALRTARVIPFRASRTPAR